MANAENEITHLHQVREVLLRSTAQTADEAANRSRLIHEIDERINLKQDPAERLLNDRRGASRGFVTRTVAALAKAMSPIIGDFTAKAVAPLKDEIAVLRQRVDELQGRAP